MPTRAQGVSGRTQEVRRGRGRLQPIQPPRAARPGAQPGRSSAMEVVRRGRHAEAYARVSPTEAAPDQEDASTSRQLWDAVRRLPEQQRDAVLLVYAEELSHAEAAIVMGIREATVSYHVHQARKTLRGLL